MNQVQNTDAPAVVAVPNDPGKEAPPSTDPPSNQAATVETPAPSSTERTASGLASAAILPLNLDIVRRATVDGLKSASARAHKEPLKQRTARHDSSRRGQPCDETLLAPLTRAVTSGDKATVGDGIEATAMNALDDEMDHVETLLSEVEAYLREKIQSNRGDETTKDIRNFVLSRLSGAQIRQYIPPLMAKLQKELGVAAIDVQTSLCMMEDLFNELGRASPLVGMYTDEEEDMLKSLELRTVL
ncbi:Aste57867_13680 [Aphanomyces stellatus]|uniref:Aste57867_13680 protein n=1 Tax=Aphanomyces stellatus TaxID=120398 RepID=A0A485KZN0_9STRA|nr:hypothetical protein As57867_013630 [Aphanomyces stellatus]VFT90513.1 Aste57867_13680 [Aphanomyces stellatus]